MKHNLLRSTYNKVKGVAEKPNLPQRPSPKKGRDSRSPKRKIVCTCTLCGGLALATSCFAGGAGFGQLVFDPSNFSKNTITAIQTTQMVTQQIQSYQKQLQQYQLQYENAKNFSSFNWRDVSQTLAQLGNTIQTGQALAYSMQNMDAAFRQTYPGYHTPTNYSQSYQSWSGSTMDTLRGALNSVSLQARDFSSEQQSLQTLRGMANNPAGQMQALQVGNMLAGDMANQMMELRQLEMTQINSQNSYMAYQTQREQAEHSSINTLVNKMDSTYPQYQNQNGFNKMPSFQGGK